MKYTDEKKYKKFIDQFRMRVSVELKHLDIGKKHTVFSGFGLVPPRLYNEIVEEKVIDYMESCLFDIMKGEDSNLLKKRFY